MTYMQVNGQFCKVCMSEFRYIIIVLLSVLICLNLKIFASGGIYHVSYLKDPLRESHKLFAGNWLICMRYELLL